MKNEDYYLDGKPYLDEVYYRVIPDAASRAVAFETGEVDVLPGGSVENWDVQRLTELENACSTGKGWEFFAPHAFMWLNNREGPTSNPLFRQAVMYAMDREFVRDVVWNGFGKVATGPVSSKTNFYSDDVTITITTRKRPRRCSKRWDMTASRCASCPCLTARRGSVGPKRCARTCRRSASKSRSIRADVAGWNEKTAPVGL